MNAKAGEAKPKRILLVDDEENLLVTLSDYLRYEGFDVTEARSAEEALERLARSMPDLMVLDMRMPGMGGESLLHRLSEGRDRPACRVLVLTARYMPKQEIAALKVDGFLPKPCELSDVAERIRDILRQPPLA